MAQSKLAGLTISDVVANRRRAEGWYLARPMSNYAVLAIGRDQTGMVASLTGTLCKLGFGIESSQMGILGDQFGMMLVVDGEADEHTLADALREASHRPADLGFGGESERAGGASSIAQTGGESAEAYTIHVTPVRDYDATRPTEPSHLVTVMCEDRCGVVSDVAEVCRDVNITHLQSSVQEEEGRGQFCVTQASITLSKGITTEKIEAKLKERLSEKEGEGRLPPMVRVESLGKE